MIKERICIVGLGLMGGSLALALRPYLSHLTVVDNNPLTLKMAQKVADVTTDSLAEGVAEADLVILATPVRVLMDALAQLPALRPDGCMVFDLGSTKLAISQAMEALPENFQAMGGHPMCGKETAGFLAATNTLYRNKTFVLCRNGRSTERIQSLAFEIVTTVGGRPLYLEPERHDQIVSAISHLPYVVSATLMQTAAQVEDDLLWPISASGFRDTSRVAGSDARMWLDILLTNKTAVLARLHNYQQVLSNVADLVEAEDEAGLMAWLTQTQEQYLDYRKRKMM